MKTKVLAIKCPTCGDIIYSRARHDFHHCSCGDIAVDGGFDYMRCVFQKVQPEQVIKYVNASKDELFQDWNNGIDKFGLIKKLTSSKKPRKV